MKPLMIMQEYKSTQITILIGYVNEESKDNKKDI